MAGHGNSTVDRNKQVVRSLFEQFFLRGSDVQAWELLTPDFVDHGAHSQQPPGPEGLAWLGEMLRDVCPDLRFGIDELLGEGDAVAVRYTMRGTMEDGDPLEEQAIAVFRFRDGRISERWAGLMR